VSSGGSNAEYTRRLRRPPRMMSSRRSPVNVHAQSPLTAAAEASTAQIGNTASPTATTAATATSPVFEHGAGGVVGGMGGIGEQLFQEDAAMTDYADFIVDDYSSTGASTSDGE
jgi:hypothetical protein